MCPRSRTKSDSSRPSVFLRAYGTMPSGLSVAPAFVPHNHPRKGRVMETYDLVVRGGTVVTASDTINADVGIRDGRIVAVAEEIRTAGKDFNASGLLVMPGGIDSHVHLSQPTSDGSRMADDFESGTRSAIAG